jgi:hypothetical protein
MDDHDERIRQRAHEIWEEEGRPEGREYSHWLRARADIRDEDGDAPAQFVLLDDGPRHGTERASKADIALNALPPGTVPENPTAENPDRMATLTSAPVSAPEKKPLDSTLDQPV